jgi:hypothetical protein
MLTNIYSDAPVIMGIVTVFALVSYWMTPEEAWLPRNRISHFIESKGLATETTMDLSAPDAVRG